MAKRDSLNSITAIIDNETMRRLQDLRLDPQAGILTLSAVVRHALTRGVAQLEYERSIGHGMHLPPLKIETPRG